MVDLGIFVYPTLRRYIAISMSHRGCFPSLTRRLQSQDNDLGTPLLKPNPKRRIKSRDDAYSVDVWLFPLLHRRIYWCLMI